MDPQQVLNPDPRPVSRSLTATTAVVAAAAAAAAAAAVYEEPQQVLNLDLNLDPKAGVKKPHRYDGGGSSGGGGGGRV
jgi:predicted porin